MAPKAQKDSSVWAAMAYQPPRGRCNYKTSLMSPACACLRFMLHPVKAATSFECDGCNHHASFHNLENPAEDAILRKWATEELHEREQAFVQQQQQQQMVAGPANKKRKLITQRAATAVVEVTSDEEVASLSSVTTRRSAGEGNRVGVTSRRRDH